LTCPAGPKTWRKSPWYASWTFNGESPLFAECDYTRHAAMKKISSSIYLLRNLRPFQDDFKRISFEDLVAFVRREGKNGAQELDLLKVFRYYAFDVRVYALLRRAVLQLMIVYSPSACLLSISGTICSRTPGISVSSMTWIIPPCRSSVLLTGHVINIVVSWILTVFEPL
jgi:hypothetical protein